MASWGDIAVGEVRPTFDHPTKSAIVGLMAAALGIRREDEDTLRNLAESYGMGIRIDAHGILLRDYHTAQVPPAKEKPKKWGFQTRREELAVPRERLETILSTRDYRCDAVYTVALWAIVGDPPYSLDRIAQSLKNPKFTLYLGRKSCPMGLPLQVRIMNADRLSDIFTDPIFLDKDLLKGIVWAQDYRIFWEGDGETGFKPDHTITRRDQPTSRKRWQFSDRQEYQTTVPSRRG
jgi:CRISPR system Cascade subunit CasD